MPVASAGTVASGQEEAQAVGQAVFQVGACLEGIESGG